MEATIWTGNVHLPQDYCYNCNGPAEKFISVQSQGGVARHFQGIGGPAIQAGAGVLVAAVIGSLVKGVGSGPPPFAVPYCERCSKKAKSVFFEGLPTFLRSWVMKERQTSPGRAFAVLNAGKDILRGNRVFVKILYTNPRVLDDIKRLNPGVEIT